MRNKIILGAIALTVSSCILCSNVYAACNHQWVKWDSYEATCSSEGKIYYECSICEEEKTEIIPATGVHKWTEWKADGYLCEDGKYTRYCEECYKEESKERLGDGSHLWGQWENWKDADCLNKGQERRTCLNCYEDEYRDIPVDENAHEWSSWYSVDEATALKSGTARRSCYVCNKIEEKQTEKLKAKIELATKKKTLKSGKSFNIRVKSYTYGDSVSKCTSSNKKIVTVSKTGKVTAKSEERLKLQ